jgi:hypothetical protein
LDHVCPHLLIFARCVSVAAIGKFESEEMVIDFLNTSRVGLAGYFFSRDAGQVWRVADALEGNWLRYYDIM